MSLLKAMVVATNAVATHAMTIDATAQAERASACSSSVTACRIAAGMLSRTRSAIFAHEHRDLRLHRCARVLLRAVRQPPYLDGGFEAGQHQEKLFQHGQLAVVLGHEDGK